ncbi:hypothetical protein V5O48_015511 [Marasmius crinis-equi]|uniref:Bacteriophage T5 Orf172 DNA-binding domain-containing protein n=1 Tax=Marasmius crinis-equi TaxID=585013 RepID=A0ABR3EUM7_9AGAR
MSTEHQLSRLNDILLQEIAEHDGRGFVYVAKVELRPGEVSIKVGQTNNLNRRVGEHRRLCQMNQNEFQILETVTVEHAIRAEGASHWLIKAAGFDTSQPLQLSQICVLSQSDSAEIARVNRIRARGLMYGTRLVGDVNRRQWLKEDEPQWRERQRQGVASGEWVVVRSGTYKGDVGLAVQPDLVGYTTSTMEDATDLQKTILSSYTTETSADIMVLLVPRLETNPPSLYTPKTAGKRKRTANASRPSPALFDPSCHKAVEKIRDGYAYEKGEYHYKEPMFSIPEGNWLKEPKLFYSDAYQYNKQLFVGSLLLRSYKKRSLFPAVSIPAHLEQTFSRSSNPDVPQFPMPYPQHWIFEEGEEIVYEPKVTPEDEDPIRFDTPLRYKFLNVAKRGQDPQTVTLKTTLLSKYIKYSAHRGMSGMVTAVCNYHVQILAMRVGETPSSIATHINSVKVISSGEDVGKVKIPWLNALVKVIKGEFADCVGIVETVDRVEGKPGRRIILGLWIPAMCRSIYTDYNNVVEKLTKAPLNSWQPMNNVQFRIYGLSASMATSREPWIGVSVLIVKGHWKGNTGTVRGVEIIWQKAISGMDASGRTTKRREGLMLQIKLDLVHPQQQPTVKINYLDAVDEKKKIFLNLAHPVKKGDLYDFQPNISHSVKVLRPLPPEQAEVPGTPQWSPEEVVENARAGAAWDPNDPDHGNSVALPYDPWNDVPVPPLAETEDIIHSPAVAGPSTSLDESDKSEMAAAAALEASIMEAIAEGEAEDPPPPPYWIVHPRLVGLTIEASVNSINPQMVKIVHTPIGVIKARLIQSRSSITVKVNDFGIVTRSPNAIKPPSKKSLMVVVGGEDEHVGKLVRQISHFYVGEKKEENHFLVLGVIEKDSEGKESLTSQRLELHRDNLARVNESSEQKRKGNEYMRDVRAASRKEIGHCTQVR